MIETRNYFSSVPYREMWDMQKRLSTDLIEKKRSDLPIDREYLLMVEHAPVITLGRHGEESNLLHAEILRDRGIECIRIERGGDITYHGPGQLVVYPILDLEAHHIGVKRYISILEEAVILTIDDYGIKGERVDGATGVWIGKGTADERKICAIGVKCSRFVTMHGLSLNVNTDLTYFNLINPCGFVDKGVTSISKEIGKEISLEEVADKLRGYLLNLL